MRPLHRTLRSGTASIEAHAQVFEQNDFVLPTPLRMDADERFTGRGVTIAFLDSGFHAHPDLTRPGIAFSPITAFLPRKVTRLRSRQMTWRLGVVSARRAMKLALASRGSV